jgi:hypothetical protein
MSDSLDDIKPIQRPESPSEQPEEDDDRLPWWLYALGGVGVFLVCGGIIVIMVLGGVFAQLGERIAPQPGATTAPAATSTPLPPTATPMPTQPPTQPPSPTPEPEPTLSPTAQPEAAAATAIPGSFDVYVSAPAETGGVQLLRWDSVETDNTITTITVEAAEGSIIRAGDFVYWLGAETNQPTRANTAGATQTLDFAAPPAGVTQYDFLPSALGEYLAWLSVSEGVYRVHLARADGSDSRIIAEGEAAEGIRFELVRVTDDGSQVFFDQRPDNVVDSLFGGYYDLYVANATSGEVAQLPGEPACGQFIACGGHISRDGAFLVRTLPSGLSVNPVIVTNLVSGQAIARLPAETVPQGAQFTLGDPIFSPGGELVYMAGYGPPDLEQYQIVFADLVSEEQRVVANLGAERHRPLGWTGGGLLLLTTRQGLYDTWQFDIVDGSSRQIASLLFVGTVIIE